jgi:hypothetical protein
MRKFGWSSLFLTVAMASGLARADERLERLMRLDRVADGARGGVRVLAREPRTRTAPRGWVVFSGSARTQKKESAPIAAIGEAVATATPHFTRAEGDIFRGAAWTVELDALLRKPAVAGTALFVFTDIGDVKGNETNGYTALFEAVVPKTDLIVADLVLPMEEGFQPQHIYRLRVTQLLHGKQVVLAEGELQLE